MLVEFFIYLLIFFGKTIEQFLLKVLSFIGACVDFNDVLALNYYHMDFIENGGHSKSCFV